jgi:hypothetical protein
MFLMLDMTNNLDTVHCPRNKINKFPWNEHLSLPVEKRRETYFVGIFRVGNAGRDQFLVWKKKRCDL